VTVPLASRGYGQTDQSAPGVLAGGHRQRFATAFGLDSYRLERCGTVACRPFGLLKSVELALAPSAASD
jgi:hypothetical protein